MTTIFASVLFAVLGLIFVANLFSVKLTGYYEVQKRLDEIKIRGNNKPSQALKSDELSFLYNNFRYKFFAKYFNNWKITEKIKEEILFSGVDMEVDAFVILSLMCMVPPLAIILMTSANLFPLSIVSGLFPGFVLKFKA